MAVCPGAIAGTAVVTRRIACAGEDAWASTSDRPNTALTDDSRAARSSSAPSELAATVYLPAVYFRIISQRRILPQGH